MKGNRLSERDKEITIKAVAMVIQKRTQIPVPPGKTELYNQYTNLTSSQKMNFWNEVSHITSFDVQQMYKYFVNTWSKGVFEEFTPEIRRYVTNQTTAAFIYYYSRKQNNKLLINTIWELIKQKIAHLNLHQGQVYAFVHHTYARCLASQQLTNLNRFVYSSQQIPKEPRSLQLHLGEINQNKEVIKQIIEEIQESNNEQKDSLSLLQQCILNESFSIQEDFGIVVSILGAI